MPCNCKPKTFEFFKTITGRFYARSNQTGSVWRRDMVPRESRDEWNPIAKETFNAGVKTASFSHTVEGATPTQAFRALEKESFWARD